ncbi:LAFA_0D03774g1_1 [Lachancea sp. 'fantastica']|nr:LAFA_0D03774g1_1 [Lachancea sp. 'fantastica']
MIHKTFLYSFLERVRPMKHNGNCISQLLCFRRYGSKDRHEPNLSEILDDWNGKRRSDTSETSSDLQTYRKGISISAPRLMNFQSPMNHSISKTKDSTPPISSLPAAVTLSSLVKTLAQLEKQQHHYEIHRLFTKYKAAIPDFRRNCSSELYATFLSIVLQTEFVLHHYVTCESLFSEYIKSPNIKSGLVDVGLVTFLKNRNLPLATEFYLQILKDPETFFVSPNTLHVFALEVFKVSDLALMKQIMYSWLDSPEMSQLTPLNGTFALFHRLLLKFDDSDGASRFLSHPRVTVTNYAASDDFAACIFHHRLFTGELSTIQDIDQNLQEALSTTNNARRLDFYIEILKHGISKNDFSLVRFATQKAQEDSNVELGDDFHKHVCHYFVKNGLLEVLVRYLTDIVQDKPENYLNHTYVEQLWSCALRKYPILSNEITNDFCLLLDREKSNLNQSDWRIQFVSEKIRNHLFRAENKKSRLSSYVSLGSHFSTECAKAIQAALSSGDAIMARSKILDELQHGMKPSFSVLYSVLKVFMEDDVEAARSVDHIMRETYPKIPTKVDILWLKQNSRQSLSFVDKNNLGSVAKVQAARVAVTNVKDFERERRSTLNFQNYMQLSSIFLSLRDTKAATQTLESGRSLMDPSSEREWYIYYSTALKVYTRAQDPEKFLTLLREWNDNGEAQFITRDTLRSCRGFIKYFTKYRATEDLPTAGPELLSQINKEMDALLARYVNYKFQGLNDMRMVIQFLTNWIHTDSQGRSLYQHSIQQDLHQFQTATKAPPVKSEKKMNPH